MNARQPAVVIGAGNIGVAVMGAQLTAGAIPVTLVAHSASSARRLRNGVRIIHGDGTGARTTHFRPHDVLASDALPAVGAAITEAPCVVVAVATHDTAALARLLWSGLSRRRRLVDVLVCANSAGEAATLRQAVERLAGHPLAHGFADVLVDQIVTNDDDPNALPTLRTESVRPLVVDASGVRAGLPEVPGWTTTHGFDAVLHHKLCTFSVGHAATAYLGSVRGHRRIDAALRDPEVAIVVGQAIREARFGLDAGPAAPSVDQGRGHSRGARDGWRSGVDELLSRYGNPVLRDTVSRVGRDPQRKLARADRICAPALLALESGGSADALALVAAAAVMSLRSDPATPARLKEADVAGVLHHTAGLPPHHAFTALVSHTLEDLMRTRRPLAALAAPRAAGSRLAPTAAASMQHLLPRPAVVAS